LTQLNNKNMASVLDQLPNSTLSLQGNGFNPSQNSPAWGYQAPGGTLDPALSQLQDTYSVDGIPNERIVDFNRQSLGGVTAVKPPSGLDELDPNAPNNAQAGTGGVVSQVYKSSPGRRYKELGPQPGRY
jgi:hypothetical protein